MEPSDEDIKNTLRMASPAAVERLAAAVRAVRSAAPAHLARWIAPEPQPDGALHVGYPKYAPEARELHDALYDAGAVVSFDSGNWNGATILDRPEDLADAPVADAVRFVTTVLRGEHFGDGVMQPYLANGTLVAAAGRVSDWQLSAGWQRRHLPHEQRAEPPLPGTEVTADELRSLGFEPHELNFGDSVEWDGGVGIEWSTEGIVPNQPGLYVFTIAKDSALHTVYVGKASSLRAIATGYDPTTKGPRGGQRYGRPKHAGVTRKRINSLVAEQHHLGRQVQHWFRAMHAPETGAEESRLIAHWRLRETGWNIKS